MAILRKIGLISAIVLAAAAVFAWRLLLFALGSVVYIYLLPWIVAKKHDNPRQREILLVSALGAWLIVPWFGALWVARRSRLPSMSVGA